MNKKVSVGGHWYSSVNYAMQQNYVPIIKDLVIMNETNQRLNNVQLKITFEPDFASEFTYDIESIDPGKSVEIKPVKINLFTDFLYKLTERMVGNIFIDVYEGEEKIYEFKETIELLAYNQWTGLNMHPELIAAFITPNHPKVAQVITNASKYLEKWNKGASLTGYQRKDRNEVKMQMAAIYAALQDEEIVYNNPPASYEDLGQRVRIPHVVLEQKQGTCLDLADLYAACLEAVGLHPIVVFKKGHAYAGCWLEEECFEYCVTEDISALQKRTVKGSEEILLVECTCFTAGKKIDFESALECGKKHLLDVDEFHSVIDIYKARLDDIRPIPVRTEQAQVLENQDENSDALDENADNNASNEKQDAENMPKENGIVNVPGDLDVEAPEDLDVWEVENLSGEEENLTKQKVWERNLLDFSLRNTLLNFRATQKTVQLMTSDLAKLEDELSNGEDFLIKEVSKKWTNAQENEEMSESKKKDLMESIAKENLENEYIRTFLTADELSKNLKKICRAAKVSIEENGTNTLFLAMGFLRWYETDLSEKVRYAPIVLVPIDIVKSNKSGGYVVRGRQEDAQINITLLEYLKQIHGLKINGLDPLPTDENGIDLNAIFCNIRQAIKDKKRWDIENMAFVGLFSFGQFVMWNDIRNRADELENNKVVSSLIEGKLNWQSEEQNVTVDNLDEVVRPDEMAIPMSADSSQMVAIAAAAKGQSFVLHGPPGTGKSQTITNMIANALHQGKSVLFVASKMAALNVVQNRLESIGLDPFCLELHSNKTNKSYVLGQLKKALEIGKSDEEEEYKATADKIHKLRNNLNDVIEALHCKREYGCSLYEAIEKYEVDKGEMGKVTFPSEFIDNATEDAIEKLNEMLRQFQVAITDVGKFEENPLKDYEGTEYSIEWRHEMEHALEEVISLSESAKKDVEELCRCLKMNNAITKKMLHEFTKLDELVSDNSVTLKELVLSPDFEKIADDIKSAIRYGNMYNLLYKELSDVFEDKVFGYNVNDASLRLKEAETNWFLPMMLCETQAVKELKYYAKEPSNITRDNIGEYHKKLAEAQKLKTKVLSLPGYVTDSIGSLYSGVNTDWESLENALEKAYAMHEFIENIEGENKSDYIDAIEKFTYDDKTNAAIENLKDFMHKVETLTEKYNLDIENQEDAGDWINAVSSVLSSYKENILGLKNWITMNQKAEQLNELGLSCITEAYKSGNVDASNIKNACVYGLYYALALKTIREDDRLKNFQGKQYEDIIAQYDETIEKFRELTAQELVAKLSAQIPTPGVMDDASPEIGVLKKAIKSNGRMLSIRKLFEQIPTLLRKLCPCMLMSPISVAQYLSPEFPKFDLVIFDEASQIPTCEAVGTIARGENVVIVGDPNQLPPTTFFHTNRIDEDNIEMEDMESLLDDCLAISMPQEHLKWHYRSRHESLIAYSNMKYYDNKLYTFPSPNDLISEVKCVHVDGYYDKGKTKQNKAEAKAVVDEIIRRLSDEKLREDSIGVVTFSAVQQDLVEDMLSETFAKHPELEEIDKNSKEPIFIKNLENVQGDERDVILFSVGYGPDKDGRVSMNFGPLNRDGGWRRLNVAISRARKSMIVYSTLRPEQIDLSRTNAEGVAGLRGFLEFAESGKNVLMSNNDTVSNEKDELVLQLAESIRKMGYKVETNIGCSEYKIDIGIVDSENPDTYKLGILLDGHNCKHAATCKDRFVLQPSVLKGLGWELMRVWTLEWMDCPEKVLQDVKNKLTSDNC